MTAATYLAPRRPVRRDIPARRACACYNDPGYCDAHAVPPVCVCVSPAPDGIGECRNRGCRRPYLPDMPLFWHCRAAWLAALA